MKYGFDSQRKQEIINCIPWMQCKSLWLKVAWISNWTLFYCLSWDMQTGRDGIQGKLIFCTMIFYHINIHLCNFIIIIIIIIIGPLLASRHTSFISNLEHSTTQVKRRGWQVFDWSKWNQEDFRPSSERMLALFLSSLLRLSYAWWFREDALKYHNTKVIIKNARISNQAPS